MPYCSLTRPMTTDYDAVARSILDDLARLLARERHIYWRDE
jgi:hypothetical protein